MTGSKIIGLIINMADWKEMLHCPKRKAKRPLHWGFKQSTSERMPWFGDKPGSGHKGDVHFEVGPLCEETVLVVVKYEKSSSVLSWMCDGAVLERVLVVVDAVSNCHTKHGVLQEVIQEVTIEGRGLFMPSTVWWSLHSWRDLERSCPCLSPRNTGIPF